MKLKVFSPLLAASTILVAVLPEIAEAYPKQSSSYSSNSTVVHQSGSGSSHTSSHTESHHSHVRISIPNLTNINRKERHSSSYTTHHKNSHSIHHGEYRALPFPSSDRKNNQSNSGNFQSGERNFPWG